MNHFTSIKITDIW